MTRRLLMFPGQGSQFLGMGEQVLKSYPQWARRASEVVGYDIVDVCLHDGDRLARTEYTQPALYVVECLEYLKLVADETVSRHDDVVCGHSVGEYAALFAAGAVTFEDGLDLVSTRGRLMAQAPTGSMAAILKIDYHDVLTAMADDLEFADLDVANVNGRAQVVVAGPEELVERFCDWAAERDGLAVKLKVSGPFHSRYMKDVAHEFREVLATKTFHDAERSAISNVDGRAYGGNSETIADALCKQIFNPVRWTDCLDTALGLGVDEFVEIGPGTALSGMTARYRAGV